MEVTSATGTRTSKSRSSQPAVVDPEGDVVLVIPTDKGKARFQINSSTLCVASSVFRAMMGRHSQFKEARVLASARADANCIPYELTLEDDNQNALAVVLRIIHLKNYLVPKQVDEDQLYEVAVICDKYDVSIALMLWADRWITALVPNESASPPTVIGHKWLFISYVFARKELFHKLSKELILTATTATDDSTALVMTAKDGSEMNEYIPDSILIGIATCRQQSIERMMDRVHRAVDTYSKPGSNALQCKKPEKQEACDSLVLGFLIRAFTSKGVYPIASSEVMHTCVRDIKGILDDMTFPTNVYCGEGAVLSTGVRYCSNCRNSGYSRQLNGSGYCSYCGRTDAMLHPNSNHSQSCSPIPDFSKEIQAIYDEVVGLNLETFIHMKIKGAMEVSMTAKGNSLWEYIEYE